MPWSIRNGKILPSPAGYNYLCFFSKKYAILAATFIIKRMLDYQTLTDHVLAGLLANGDHKAYTQLYNRYFRLLYGYTYRKLQREDQSKDIIQEFFTELWAKREQLTPNENVGGYFFTAVNNRILNFFLREDVKSRYVQSFMQSLPGEGIATDHLVREKQLMALIEIEIQALPEKMRRIFELSRKEHLTHKEIAERLSISEKTVDRQISNAINRLRSKLEILLIILYFHNMK
jgi:RNA polymerase sigma-70 factor (family 1)